MSIFDQATLGRHLSKLMSDKLGKFVDWRVPDVRDTVGPFEPDVFSSLDLRKKKIVDECHNKLASYSDEMVQILIGDGANDPDEVRKEWSWFLRKRIMDLGEKEPPWYAAGFGHSAYRADFVYWAQCPHFSRHEALMLSLGLEPKHFTEREIGGYKERQEKGVKQWASLCYLVGRQEQISRQFPRYRGDKVSPKDLFDWFELVGLDVHPEFTSRYVSSGNSGNADSYDAIRSKPHKREVDTISQLFAAMAIEYYGYDPKAPRSPVPKEIVELAATMGIEVTDDTVRKYLRVGASFISDDWEPN